MRTLALVLLVGCGATSPEPVEGPRAIRTAEHLEEARKHDEIARSRTSWPVTREVTPGDPTTTTPAMPWITKWAPESDHERIAKAHRSEVAANEVEYQNACGQREVEKVVGSPLTRHRVGGWNTDDGVVVLLSPLAGSEKQLLADLRCHRAWLMAGVGVDKDSPLALPGLLVDAKGNQDGITLTITTRDKKMIPELQRRVLRGLEEMQRPRHED
jgi:hypothetical protein